MSITKLSYGDIIIELASGRTNVLHRRGGIPRRAVWTAAAFQLISLLSIILYFVSEDM